MNGSSGSERFQNGSGQWFQTGSPLYRGTAGTGRVSGSRTSERSCEQSKTGVDRLTERERRFVEAYMGEAAGNATKAALAAGYSPRNARQQGYRLLTKAYILAAIAARTQDDPAVAGREARQRLWTDIAFGRNGFAEASLRDRLKASELLGRSQADFVDRHQHEGTISVDIDPKPKNRHTGNASLTRSVVS